MNYKLNEKLSKISSNSEVGEGIHDIGTSVLDRYKDVWAINFKGDSTSSYYADLAEKYTVNPDFPLPVGTVMEVSTGKYDSEICETEVSDCVIGIISESPGFVMNEDLKNSATIGLIGTLPVRVIGEVNKKDILVSAGNGCLRVAANDYEKTFKVAISFENNNDETEKLVKCLVK